MHSKQSLIDSFFALGGNLDERKILKLKKRMVKFLNSKGQDEQLADFVRILDMYVEEMGTNKSELSHHIMLPVLERLINACDWDFVDIRVAALAVGFARNYKIVDDFAQRALTALENYKSDELYARVKLSICYNTAGCLLRAKYYDLGHTTVSEEMDELTVLFEKYADMVMAQPDKPEFWMPKLTTPMRRAIFFRDNDAIDASLIELDKKGNAAACLAMATELNHYNAFVGDDITKLQHNIRVGDSIRKLRLSKGIRVDDFAKMLNLSGPFLHSIERGKRGATTYNILKISEKMDVTTDSLIRGTFSHKGEPKTKNQKLKALIDIMEAADVDWLYDSANYLIKVRHSE